MAIPWTAQQQDAELIQELAEYSLPLATIGLGQSLLHLHLQLLRELWRQEELAQKAKGPGVLRWVLR